MVTIVPAGMCPGHFDVKPKDAQALSDASLLLKQGFEQFVDDLIKSTGNKKLIVETVDVKGSWMVPETQIKATERICSILCRMFPKWKEDFQSNAEVYEKSIMTVALHHKKESEAKHLGAQYVVCNEYQKPFLEWLGFNVVATYGRETELTPKKIAEVIEKARSFQAKIVVDNLQSGPEAGKAIVSAIDGVHVTLTNFPLEGSYIGSLNDNVQKLLRAVELSF